MCVVRMEHKGWYINWKKNMQKGGLEHKKKEKKKRKANIEEEKREKQKNYIYYKK